MKASDFNHATRKLRPRLMGLAMDFFHNREDAEDVVQEVLLRLWQRPSQPEDNLEALAVRATKNLCVSLWRKRQLRQTHPLEEALPLLTEGAPAEQALLGREEARRLRKALERLPLSEQRLMRMRLYDELESDEIAAITGIGLRSVRTMLSSARKKLIKLLQA